ncbi:hypothetical protein HOLleu_31450 [Holothuria leucospilota]|uniref:Uncharacterized protein n=1 Tax=Holothuria leucospilota TaxID=206669 RepID=A0A9Q0YQG1_HOLLE|nr:hypothetical protein HOLleu_31450 [Holothuria leucospilota]
MPFNLDKFVASPSVEELDSLKKSEIVKVAKHYGIEFQPLMRKDEIKRYVLEYLVDESILPSTVLETAITVPTDNTFELKRLEIEMNKEIRLKEMEREREREERERERKEREMQMQKEKEEREMQMQKEKEEREMQMQMQREKEAREHEFRLKQLELGVIKASDPKIGLDTGGFDVSKHVKFVPKFQEDNVEKFFNHFEKLGQQLKWPRDKWSILIQSNFTGKAQEVYSALSIEDSMDYDKVKKAILQAYELVPEAYRQKFRKYRKADTQTYVEFAYQKERHFDRWCASKKVSTFDTLRQLMLVEKFKRCVNDDIKTHLEENKADNLKEVANLADQYALTHKFGKVGQTQNKGQFSRPNKKYGNNSGTTGNSGSQSGSISPTNSGKKQPESSRQKNDQDCESPGPTHSEGVEQEKSKMSDTLHRDQLSVQQQHDEELQPLIAGALTEDESKDVPVCFYLKNNILMRKWRPPDALLDEEWRIYHQIVVPRTYRREILSIAHEMPFAGHLGVNKTYHRILNHFYWPKLKSDVAKFCKTCHSCQMAGKPNQNIPAAPLKPIPAFEEPFSRVIIDCVGPLPKSRAGHQYILTIMCASTRFPEAIPLRNIKARTVLQALLKFFTLFGLPKEIQSDQGSNFMSTVFQQMLYELGIDQIKSSAYHPESQGALERFHQTLKNMLKTYCHDNERDWDEGIPFVMFAARESIQESLGFSPFELVFGHTVRGPLKLLKEKWLSDPGEDIHLLDYVSRFKDRLNGACELAQENLRHSQKKMKAWYDKTTVKREFKPGDKVLVFLPVSGQPLQARFQGPYVIEKKVSDTDYVILTPDKRKSKRVCHINMMKKYFEREDCDISKDESVHAVNSNNNDTGDQVCIINADHELSNDEIKANNVPDMCIKIQNSDMLKNLDQKLSHLDHKEKSEMKSLIYEYACLFSDDPTRTSLIEHDVDVGDATPIKQHPYRVNPRKRQHLRDEVRYMLDHDIIEPSNSEWSSPCILVPKPDGGYRFCTDYRKVNAVTRTDSYPIPRIDDCIDRIGKATYVSKFDLLKGYWEIPLTERARKISAFVTPDGLFQYKVVPFGMKNSQMTFKRLVNNLTSDLENCEVYVNDLIVCSNSWDEHVQHVKALFDKLAKANLTVNLGKSEIACAHVVYLGHVVGQGKVRPIKAKVEGVDKFPAPTDKRQLMRFLGMAGYYRRFCPNFSDIAAPLTKLLKKNEKFDWTDNCQAAFELLKKALMSSPVLIAPDFEKQFKLAVDASDNGIGAVLLQADEHGVDHPVCYYSKKFDKHQKNYSTIEKETLALILGLQHFDVLFGTTSFPITVYTDHNPLTFLSKMNKNQRLMRWSFILQSYNVDIKHIKGKDNVVPDSLSRI